MRFNPVNYAFCGLFLLFVGLSCSDNEPPYEAADGDISESEKNACETESVDIAELPNPRFAVEAEGTVTDRWTGIVWAKKVLSRRMTDMNCEEFNKQKLGGRSDWTIIHNTQWLCDIVIGIEGYGYGTDCHCKVGKPGLGGGVGNCHLDPLMFDRCPSYILDVWGPTGCEYTKIYNMYNYTWQCGGDFAPQATFDVLCVSSQSLPANER